MVLYTVIGEYDILYAQERELYGYGESAASREIMSTNPQDFLGETALSESVRSAARPYRNDLRNTNKRGII